MLAGLEALNLMAWAYVETLLAYSTISTRAQNFHCIDMGRLGRLEVSPHVQKSVNLLRVVQDLGGWTRSLVASGDKQEF